MIKSPVGRKKIKITCWFFIMNSNLDPMIIQWAKFEANKSHGSHGTHEKKNPVTGQHLGSSKGQIDALCITHTCSNT